MKVKKFLGQTINGFVILDTYSKNLPAGTKTRKVLLKCEKCGRVFERNSGIDFEHIKCKCMCKSANKKNKYHYIEFQGKKYTQTEFCKIHNICVSTFKSRIEKGMKIEEAIKKTFINECQICEKQFEASRPDKKYCCKTCANRAAHKKGKYKKMQIKECIVCGKKFETLRNDAKTCSKKCRYTVDRMKRNKYFKNLKTIGKFDYSIKLENVYKKYNGICQKCGKSLNFNCSPFSDNYPTIDHIIPLSKNGVHEWDNVQLLCRKCNYTKSDI